LPGQRASGLDANARNNRRFRAEGDDRAGAAAELIQLVVEIGLEIFTTLGETWQMECPEVDSREQIVAEPTLTHAVGQIAIGPGDQLEVARDLAIPTEGEEPLFLERTK
jgi:hypothetical protein